MRLVPVYRLIKLAKKKRVVVSYKRKYVHEVLVKCLVNLAKKKKRGKVNWPSRHDHSC